eukprot:g46146.t1
MLSAKWSTSNVSLLRLREVCAKFNLTKLKDYNSVTLGKELRKLSLRLLAKILVRLLMYEACPSKSWHDWVVACKPGKKKYPQPTMNWKAELSEGILLVPVTRWPKHSGSLMNYQANRVKYARAATVLNHIFPMGDVGV